MTTTKKTFAEKIAESEKTDSDSSIEKGVIPKGIELVKEEKPEKKARKPRQKKVKVEDNEVLVDEETGGSIPEVKKEKVKRPPSAYNLFVKDAYKLPAVQKLPPKERFSKVAELWQKEKKKKK